jgi:hypothetical protein
MKMKNYYLLIVLIVLLASTNLCLARDDDKDINFKVVAQSTFLSYKTVKDNFGKKFAKSYFVVQVDIRNENEDKQFIVQTIDVFIDPTQCSEASKFYESLSVGDCKKLFNNYFYIPGEQQPIRSEEVLAAGKADLNRSNRNVGFRFLAFAANMGTILTGFNGLIGRDGILGINVLGTTATAAANALFPNTADVKLENLRNALPTEDIIIKSKESKTFNIFIPTERVFWKDSWNEYIKSAQDSNYDTFKLKKVLELILLSSATGVLVDNNAPKVEALSNDGFRRQKEKVNRANYTEAQIDNVKAFQAKMELLQRNLDNPETKAGAEKTLKNILDSLKKQEGIKTVLQSKVKIKDEPTGKDYLQAIRELMRALFDEENGEALKQTVRDIVINEQ